MDARLAEVEANLFREAIFGEAMEFCFRDRSLVNGSLGIDLGAGKGYVAVYLALLGARVVALDSNFDAIRRARQLADQYKVADQVVFLCARAESVPLRSQSLDLVFSRSTFQYMDLNYVIPEILRVLRVNGTLLSIQNLPNNPFVFAYRTARQILAKSESEISYVKSIKEYTTTAHADRIAGSFREFRTSVYHVFGPLAMSSHRRNWQRRVSAFGTVDRVVLRAVPATRKLAWIGAFVFDHFHSIAEGTALQEVTHERCVSGT